MRRVLLLFLAAAAIPRAGWPQGGPLGPEFRVNTFTTNNQRQPAVSVAGTSGDFVVVWKSDLQDGSSYGVFGQRFSASGVALGPEFRANTFIAGKQGFGGPWVASDGPGNFVANWISYGQDGSGFGIYAQRYASSGAPLGLEFRANTYTTNHQGLTSVAAAPGGSFVVVWEGNIFPSGLDQIFGQRFNSAGAPLGAEFQVNTMPDVTGEPVVASGAAGNFVVVWLDNDNTTGLGVFGRRFDASGAPLGVDFRVNSYTTGNQNFAHVASDSAGNFVVVWGSPQEGSGYGVFAQRFASTGAPLGGEFRVNTFTPNNQGGSTTAPAVASDAGGNFVVVWGSDGQDGFFSGIFGQRFDSAGVPLGPEFRVNSYTTNDQRWPAVAADAAGNFVAVWNSYSQDGGLDGVFGQRFGPILPVELTRFTVE